MPKGPSRQWRKRKEPILDDAILAAVMMKREIYSRPHDYLECAVTLNYADPKTETAEIKRALHRSATFLGHSLTSKIVKSKLGGEHVNYTVFCKDCARAYVQLTYPDPEKRPYNPRRPRNETDHK